MNNLEPLSKIADKLVRKLEKRLHQAIENIANKTTEESLEEELKAYGFQEVYSQKSKQFSNFSAHANRLDQSQAIQTFLKGAYKPTDKTPEEQEAYDLWRIFYLWITAQFINDPINAPYKPKEKELFIAEEIRNHLVELIKVECKNIWDENPSWELNAADMDSSNEEEIQSSTEQNLNPSKIDETLISELDEKLRESIETLADKTTSTSLNAKLKTVGLMKGEAEKFKKFSDFSAHANRRGITKQSDAIQSFLNGAHKKESNKKPEEQEMYDLWGAFHYWVTALFINDPENARFKPEKKELFLGTEVRDHFKTFIKEECEKIWEEKLSQSQNASDKDPLDSTKSESSTNEIQRRKQKKSNSSKKSDKKTKSIETEAETEKTLINALKNKLDTAILAIVNKIPAGTLDEKSESLKTILEIYDFYSPLYKKVSNFSAHINNPKKSCFT